jgi:hypothetical protein
MILLIVFEGLQENQSLIFEAFTFLVINSKEYPTLESAPLVLSSQ